MDTNKRSFEQLFLKEALCVRLLAIAPKVLCIVATQQSVNESAGGQMDLYHNH